MPTILFTSIVSITAALIAYIIVYVMNRKTPSFTWGQFAVLIFAVAADILGTAMMAMLAEGFRFDMHSILGYSALLMMLVMSGYAFYGLVKKKEDLLEKFGKYYFPAMVIWVLSYGTGVVLGIEKVAERNAAG